jgi:hypothetical protein
MPAESHLFALAGKVDVTNRYPSSVLVTVEFDEDERGVCSGAVIGRRLVLTAGHCLCRPRRITSEPGAVRSLVDGSACAATARVTTIFYEPREVVVSGEDTSASKNSHEGAVHPHPELRILLDARAQVVSSHADLALILLEEPLDKKFPSLRLADTEVELNESLIVVGTGYDELASASDWERRSSRNKVTEPLPSGDERLRIEQPGGHHYKGDSGGPCLRETLTGTSLVGISSRSLGEGEAITSTYAYRDWLRGEIQSAEALKLPARSE